MDTAEITYKELRKLQEHEKKSPLLTKIHQTFYQQLHDYKKTLNTQAEQEENPQKQKLYKDEISNTQKIITNIYELREKKIVQAALSQTRGGTPDLNNMLDIERTLYENLTEQITLARQEILLNKKPVQQITSNTEIPPEKTKDEPIERSPTAQPNELNNNQIVQVLQDIPEFIGIDMKKYNLRKNDVISLSEDMSKPLIKRKVVKPIKL